MEDEVEEKMMCTCLVMLTLDRDRGHHQLEDGNDRTAIQDPRPGRRPVVEGAQRGARHGGGDGVQATALTAATVGAGVEPGVEQEAEGDMGGGEVVTRGGHEQAVV